MDQQFLDLYHRHVGTAFDRQRRFAEYLARKAPNETGTLDTENAVLAYGPKLKFEAPLLGEHTHHNQSWVWAWTDKHRKLSFTNRALGETLRAVAHRLGLHYLTHPGFPLEPLLGPELTEQAADILGVVLGAELGFDAYFIAPHEDGETLVLVRDDRLKANEKHPLRRMINLFPQAIMGMPSFNHKAALRGYADDVGITATEDGDVLKLTAGKDSLTATFDVHDRLTYLESNFAPEPEQKPVPKLKPKAAAKKPAKKIVKAAATTKKKAAKPTPKTVAKAAAKKPAKAVAKKVGEPAKKPGKKR